MRAVLSGILPRETASDKSQEATDDREKLH
jgi:hypothetical protein